MTYSFRFKMKPAHGIFIESTEGAIGLLRTKSTCVELRSWKRGEAIRDSEYLVVVGNGYETPEEAGRACNAWTSFVKTGLSGASVGADFFSRASSGGFTGYAIEVLERESGRPVVSDSGGPHVFKTDPAPLFVSAGPVGVRKGVLSPTVEAHIQFAAQTNRPMSKAAELAYDLYSGSIGLPTPDARLVMLVTAIEALIDPPDREPAEQRVVDELEQIVSESEISTASKQGFGSTLSRLRKQSIGQAGAELLEALSDSGYENETPGQFFRRCYNIRSAIVHGNPRRPELTEVQTRAAVLELAVGRLIAAVTNGVDYRNG